jgi:tRNA U34 5-methylaminomethyl-2-thiouridine-forming methyltransferase MnmC
MHRKIIVTEDNSKTLLIPELKETYHSTKGALTEALHIFIKEGIIHSNKNELNIFEMGMGTGLNALLSFNHSTNNGIKIIYSAIEKYPLEINEVNQLEYLKGCKLETLREEFELIHNSPFNRKIKINEDFELYKINDDVVNLKMEENSIDIIFYDAFGPKVQEKLWGEEVMSKMHSILKPKGFLVTYCAQGAFKRTLKALNFEIENIPGPPGKREMTRAFKK